MYPTLHLMSACLLAAPPQAEKPQPNIELKISLSKSEIVQLEPIVLTISVKNQSSKVQKIYPIFEPEFQYLKIYVRTTEGKSYWLRPGAIADGGTGPYELAAKDVIRYRLMLSGGPNGWMDTLGEHKLQITFRCLKDAEPLVSNTVKVTVKEAKGVDREALDRFRGYPHAKFLARLSTASAIAEQFQFVTRKYPQSAYTPWCYYTLGWAAQANNQAENARHYYRRLLKESPNFPMKTEVEYEPGLFTEKDEERRNHRVTLCV